MTQVQCNNCGWQGSENELIVKNDIETCKKCGENSEGKIVDIVEPIQEKDIVRDDNGDEKELNEKDLRADSLFMYEEIKRHIGHKIECVSYGRDIENVSIECADCNEVLIDYDK